VKSETVNLIRILGPWHSNGCTHLNVLFHIYPGAMVLNMYLLIMNTFVLEQPMIYIISAHLHVDELVHCIYHIWEC
jgi:hypothetical protein